MTAQRNSNWQSRVKMFLRQGYGVEDIAVMLKEDVDAIRREVAILREEGELAGMFGGNNGV